MSRTIYASNFIQRKNHDTRSFTEQCCRTR
nr:MAG TPA: hypothetical protein [Inoviridae sp.]